MPTVIVTTVNIENATTGLLISWSALRTTDFLGRANLLLTEN